jgi:hypothetical protein
VSGRDWVPEAVHVVRRSTVTKEATVIDVVELLCDGC